MLNFYPDLAVQHAARGQMTFYENGRDVGSCTAFSPSAMVGLRLALPRALGTVSVRLLLHRDGEAGEICFPLRRCGCERGQETYAVLLEGETLSACADLYTACLCCDTAFGPLYVQRQACGAVSFSRTRDAAEFLLFFPPNTDVLPLLLGGAIYALPLQELSNLGRLFRGDDLEYDSFFAHLRALGVRAIWLSPPAASTGDMLRYGPSPLPQAFTAAAEKSGICLLYDLLCCSAMQDDGAFLSPVLDRSGEAADGRPGFWRGPIPFAPVSLQEHLLGIGGVAKAIGAAGGGLFVRGLGCFGDALLSALHKAIAPYPLLGTAEEGAAPIQLGVRRRYLLDHLVDGVGYHRLRHACLAYLLEGDTAPLGHYLSDVLPSIPAAMQAGQLHALSTYADGSFFAALAEHLYQQEQDGSHRAYSLAELGQLIAGTLPGLPLYLAGEENGLPYPPEQGEAVGGQLAFFLRLAQLRRREPVYRDGLFRLLHLSAELLVFSREREGEALLTVINRSERRLVIASPDGFSLVFGGRGLKNVFAVRPYTGVVLKASCWVGEVCRLRFLYEAAEDVVQPMLANCTVGQRQ